ncbi:MAG: sulfur carrier protein ThiS [Halothiobacillus sp.]
MIFLNGEPRQIRMNSSVSDLLLVLQLHQRRLAVELNGEILPRHSFSITLLNANDRLELVHAIGGG